ncbi:AraC family transcriptional regulator [Nibrella saemangeumensis]|uniref:AraC family transcriptional regulator n=1 Tax=Nibrella saemangeumensis TaxID=1084526 RepID=A0ABP8NLI9_9BACT
MLYRKYQPAPPLQPFVECYFVWDSEQNLPEAFRVESPPNGFGSIVLNYGGTYAIQNPKHSVLEVPAAFITGQATHSYQLTLHDSIHMVGIVFKPTGLSNLFGLPMYEFSDERFDLLAVLGEKVQGLYDRIGEAPDMATRVTLLEQFLLYRLSLLKNPLNRTDYAANLIVEKRGVININELIGDLYICRRQFERQFLHKIGVSAKYYARIRRISYLCAELASNRWNVSDWHEIIYKAGYYDQSHFIKDFTGFTGKSPSLYVKSNIELANYLRDE